MKNVDAILRLPDLYKVAYCLMTAKIVFDDRSNPVWVPWDTWSTKWFNGCSYNYDDESDGIYTILQRVKDSDLSPTRLCYLAVTTTFDITYFNLYIERLKQIKPEIMVPVLTTHFICPHCYKTSQEHLKSGKCLFSAHTWEGINNVWRP